MNKEKIVAIISAAILLFLCLWLSFGNKKSGKTEYDVVFFGDSVIAGDHYHDSVPEYLSQFTGLSVLNAAFGGTKMSLGNPHDSYVDYSMFFSGASLSYMVRSGDFSALLSACDENDERMCETAQKIVNTNWDAVDFIFLEECINDYTCGVVIENSDDFFDSSTFAGALRTAIVNLQKKLPNAKIIIVSPIYCAISGYDGDCLSHDFGGGVLTDFIAKEKEIAEEYGLLFINNFDEVPINASNYNEYLGDGLHENAEGAQMIARNIAKYVVE